MISSPVDRIATIGFRQTCTIATPICREHAGVAAGQDRSAPQDCFAGGDVGAGKRDAAAGGHGAADVHVVSGFSRTGAGLAKARHYIRVFDHHDGVGAARHHAAGGDRHGLAGSNDGRRDDAGVNHLVGQAHAARDFLRRAECVLGHHGKAIDVGAIERRHIDR